MTLEEFSAEILNCLRSQDAHLKPWPQMKGYRIIDDDTHPYQGTWVLRDQWSGATMVVVGPQENIERAIDSMLNYVADELIAIPDNENKHIYILSKERIH